MVAAAVPKLCTKYDAVTRHFLCQNESENGGNGSHDRSFAVIAYVSIVCGACFPFLAAPLVDRNRRALSEASTHLPLPHFRRPFPPAGSSRQRERESAWSRLYLSASFIPPSPSSSQFEYSPLNNSLCNKDVWTEVPTGEDELPSDDRITEHPGQSILYTEDTSETTSNGLKRRLQRQRLELELG